MEHRVVWYAFGDSPFVFEPFLQLAKMHYPSIKWYAILPRSNHLKKMTDLLGNDDDILCMPSAIKRYKNANISVSNDYPSNLFFDIETDRDYVKERSGPFQVDYTLRIYQAYKDFLLRVKPSYIIYPSLQTYDGVILFRLAQELGIRNAVVAHTRQIGRSYFSDTLVGKLPDYATITEDDKSYARTFLETFRSSEFQHMNINIPIENTETYPLNFPSLPKRAMAAISRIFDEPDGVTKKEIRLSLLNNLSLYRDFIRYVRVKKNERLYNIASLDDLPKRFIYYPLQFTPEISIHIPAPEYVDQIRAIDAIRFSMPNDTLLVVKEHPLCISRRSGELVKRLLKCAGVLVVDYKTSSKELIKRAALTVSVTGTATIEAFLLGQPSLTLGENLYTEFLGGKCKLQELSLRIKETMNQSVSEDDILNAIAKIHNGSYPFVCRALKTPSTIQMVMNKSNVRNFLDAFISHMQKVEKNN